MFVCRLRDLPKDTDLDKVRSAILMLREEGFTNILLAVTKYKNKEWTLAWEFDGVDGGDPCAAHKLAQILNNEIKDVLSFEYEEIEEEEDSE